MPMLGPLPRHVLGVHRCRGRPLHLLLAARAGVRDFKPLAHQHVTFSTQSKSEAQLQPDHQEGSTYHRFWTIPNVLSLSRIAATPVLGYWVLTGSYKLAFSSFIVLGFTDWLDGYIAKTYGQHSKWGSILDPLGDKFLVVTLASTVTFQGLLPVPLAALVVLRDVGLVFGTAMFRGLSLKKGERTLQNYFDISQVNFEVQPSLISKTNTAAQICLLASTLGCAAAGISPQETLWPMWYIVAGTTFASGADYALNYRRALKKPAPE